jgi:cullin 3
MGMVRDILLYVDRNYCKFQQKLPVYSLSLKIFREHLINHTNIRGRLQQLLMENIQAERCGGVIDRDIMRTILIMYQDISVDISSNRSIFVYEEEFEAPFLAATKEFYHAESNAFLANVS